MIDAVYLESCPVPPRRMFLVKSVSLKLSIYKSQYPKNSWTIRGIIRKNSWDRKKDIRRFFKFKNAGTEGIKGKPIVFVLFVRILPHPFTKPRYFLNISCGRRRHRFPNVRRNRTDGSLHRLRHRRDVVLRCCCLRHSWGSNSALCRSICPKAVCKPSACRSCPWHVWDPWCPGICRSPRKWSLRDVWR